MCIVSEGYVVKIRWQIPFLWGLWLLSYPCYADIWKCVDEHGAVTYTNNRPNPQNKGCSVLSREQPVNSFAPPSDSAVSQSLPSSSSSALSYPQIDRKTQNERDMSRRQILEKELAQERDLLTVAQRELSSRSLNRSPEELEKDPNGHGLKSWQDRVAEHRRNIESIRRELTRLK